jgi:hypothetical protein
MAAFNDAMRGTARRGGYGNEYETVAMAASAPPEFA